MLQWQIGLPYTNHSGYPGIAAPDTVNAGNAEIFAPVPLSQDKLRSKSNTKVAYQESLQNELGSFMSSQMPDRLTPSSVQFLSPSVHHAWVFSANQSGKA